MTDDETQALADLNAIEREVFAVLDRYVRQSVEGGAPRYGYAVSITALADLLGQFMHAAIEAEGEQARDMSLALLQRVFAELAPAPTTRVQ